jgi:hypothetical protein
MKKDSRNGSNKIIVNVSTQAVARDRRSHGKIDGVNEIIYLRHHPGSSLNINPTLRTAHSKLLQKAPSSVIYLQK